ncbi:endonuclease domain-containing protein [Microbacterium sp. HJ5]
MPRLELPGHLGPSFSVADARGSGVGEGRLRGPDLERLSHGTRIVATAAPRGLGLAQGRAFDLRRRIDAYLPAMPPDAFFAGPTAAALHGLPLPPAGPIPLHVGVPHPRSAPRRAGVVGVQVLPHLVGTTTVDGVRITDLPTTWAMLGRHLGLYDLVAVADAIIRVPRHPGGFRPPSGPARGTREQLRAAIDAGHRRGSAMLRRALDRARDGVSSRPESWLRLVLVDGDLPEPVLDHDVYTPHGQWIGCSELAYPEAKVAVEYESDGHLTRRQLERDIDKYTAYSAAGWRTVRLTSTHVFTVPREAVRRVRVALQHPSV